MQSIKLDPSLIPYAKVKISSQWIRYINVSLEIMKLLEKNIIEKFLTLVWSLIS